MHLTKRPALRGLLAGLLAVIAILALDFAPLHLVAYGQTAGPLPKVELPAAAQTAVAGQPAPVRTAIAGDTPSNCNALSGPLTADGGAAISTPCSGGGTLAISAPGGAADGDGTVSLITVGDALSASTSCTAAGQLPVLATQHFLFTWQEAGQPPRVDLGRPATIEVPIAPAVLASAGSNPARIMILHALPDDAVTPILATFSTDDTTATFQSSRLGDFYAVAVPAGLPASYGDTADAVDAANHRFVLSGPNGRFNIQSYDLQGGTILVHADGSPATFAEIPAARSVQVQGMPSAASCGKPNDVIATRITLGGVTGVIRQAPGTSPLPAQLPSTGMGGLAHR